MAQEKFAGWLSRLYGGGRPNLVYSPGPGLCPLSLDLLDLTWDLDLDLGLGPGPELDNMKINQWKQPIYIYPIMQDL